MPFKPTTHCKNGHEWTSENTMTIRRAQGGTYRRCRICSKAKQQDERDYRTRYSRRYLRERAGVFITDKEVSEVLVSQDGLCAICYEKPAVVVDHDHDTGKIRGMLCRGCNLALGLLGDNEEGIRLALEYLAVPRLEEAI